MVCGPKRLSKKRRAGISCAFSSRVTELILTALFFGLCCAGGG